MNLVHIATSYLSYQHLPAGSALALFYLYPFFNILAGVLFLGDSFDTALILPLIIAFIGVLLISKYTEPGGSNSGDEAHDKGSKNIPLGILASVVSALTETMIFLVAKTGEETTAWLPILKLYPAAFGGLVAALAVTGAEWKTSLQNWFPLVLFNVCIGFLGYSLRFWSIPRLPTAIFSLLTFVGIAAAYMWGLMYAEEKPSLGALGGAGCIAAALAILKQKN
jgi:drug/metabolite transporter (DMT)-like permease